MTIALKASQAAIIREASGIRLSTRAGSGNFRVDDVYVDPRHH